VYTAGTSRSEDEGGLGRLYLARQRRDGSHVDGSPLDTAQLDGEAHDLALAADGSVFVVGAVTVSPPPEKPRKPTDCESGEDVVEMALWRFDADLQLFDDFPVARGGAGDPCARHEGRAVAVDDEGAVWVAGSGYDTDGAERAVVWRFSAEGELLTGFPYVYEPEHGSTFARDLVVEDEGGGAWVVGGLRGAEGYGELMLWHVGRQADPDELTGLWQSVEGWQPIESGSIAMDERGTIWFASVVGDADGSTDWAFSLFKLDASHRVEQGFPRAAACPLERGCRRPRVPALALDGQGRAWLAGGVGGDMALWAVDSEGAPLPGFPRLHEAPNAGSPGGATAAATGVAVDVAGVLWVAGYETDYDEAPEDEVESEDDALLWRFH